MSKPLSTSLRAVEGTVFGVDQTAIHDGPGVRMNLYLKGCPLHCLWCHSPESQAFRPEVVWYEVRCRDCGRCVEVCPEGLPRLAPTDPRTGECRLCEACVRACAFGAREVKGRRVSAGTLADEAARLRPFFRHTGGGVTLTGGEPVAQHRFAHAVAALCAAQGIHVAMETTGYVPWERMAELAKVVDLFLYDVKHADARLHRQYTGVSNRRILDNLRRLLQNGADVIVRVPLIPGINDDPPTVEAIAAAAAARGATRITLLPYNPATGGKYSWLRRPEPLPGATRQSPAHIARLEQTCRKGGLEVVTA